jgi:hypothetical protein
MIRARVLLAAMAIAAAVGLLSPNSALADNCSSSADCANVVQGTGLLAMALAIILGAGAATAKKRKNPKADKREKKYKDCKEFVDSLNRRGEDGEVAEKGEADSKLDPKLTPKNPTPVASDGTFKVTTRVTWSFSDRRSTTWVERPYWDNMSKTEEAAVDEWVDRMKAHEDGHHNVARDFGNREAKEISGEGDTPDEALKDLQRKLEKYNEDTQEGLHKARKDYEDKTKNGRNQAAVGGKNTTFTCPE